MKPYLQISSSSDEFALSSNEALYSRFSRLSANLTKASFQFIQQYDQQKTDEFQEIIKRYFLDAQRTYENPQLIPFIRKVNTFVENQLSALLSPEVVELITRQGCLCILNKEIETIETFTEEHSCSSCLSKEVKRSSPMPLPNNYQEEDEKISVFVNDFNKFFRRRKEYREKARTLISEIEKRSWIHAENENKLTLNPEEIFIAKKSLMQLYSCQDSEIKEKVLRQLIEIVECDPLSMESAYGLVELQKQLVRKIQTNQAQNLNTQIQRLLVKAFAITLECILIQASLNHLNALTKEIKDQIWTNAKKISGSNIVEDPEIGFWAKYAAQGAMNINTGEGKTTEWFIRIAGVTRGIVGLALSIVRSSDVLPAMDQLFDDMRQAFHNIENKKEWFANLLLLKKFSRYWMNDAIRFNKVVELIKKQACNKTKKEFLYGLVSTLEYTALKSSQQEVKEESLKLLLQYYFITHQSIRGRVHIALDTISKWGDPKLGNTARMVISLLEATKKQDPAKETLHTEPQFPDKEAENTTSSFDRPRVRISLLPQDSGLLGTIQESSQNNSVSRPQRSRKSFLFSSVSFSAANLGINKENVYKNVIEFLIRRVAGIKEKSNHPHGGDSLVTLLSSSTNDEVVPALLRRLLHFSSEFHGPNVVGETPFHIAVKAKNGKMIQHISKALDININAQEYEDLNTALHYAAQQKLYDIVCILLKLGANPNIQNRFGFTPLHHAVFVSSPAIIEQLLKSGARWDIMDQRGITSFDLAINLDQTGLVKIFLDPEKNPLKDFLQISPVLSAARKRSIQTLIELLQNIENELSPLESLEIMRMMISRGRKKICCPEEFCHFHISMMEKNKQYHSSFSYYSEWPKLEYSQNGKLILIQPSRRKETLPYDPQIFQKGRENLDPFGNTLTHHWARKKLWLSSLAKVLKTQPDTLNQRNYLGITPLHAAVINNNYEGVRLLLKRKKIDTSLADIRGFTALHLAVYMENKKIIKLLIRKGANPNAQNDYGDTPFLLYCGHDSARSPESLCSIRLKSKKHRRTLSTAPVDSGAEILELMLEHKADPCITDNWGNNALHHAGQWGSLSMIEYLCQKFPKLFWKKNALSLLPIYAAIQQNRGHCIESFLQENIASDQQSLCKRFSEETSGTKTAGDVLVCAKQMGMLGILFDSIPESAYYHDSTPLAYTPLHTAASLGYVEIIEEYTKRDLELDATDAFGNTALHLSALKSKTDFLTKLLVSGAIPHKKNQDGRTAMHLAVTRKGSESLETFKVVFEQHPEMALERDGYGDTPLHLASHYGNLEIVKLICRKYPCLTIAVSDDVNTPLHLACASGYSEIADFLTEHQEDLEMKNTFGLTPLMLAAQQGHESVLEVLMKKNADIRTRDDEDETPLHKAAFNRHLGTVRLLLLREHSLISPEKRRLVKNKDVNGDTALHKLARRSSETGIPGFEKDKEILTDLINAGADVNKANKQGDTFLHLACYLGLDHFLEFLGDPSKHQDIDKKIQVDFSVVNHRKDSLLHKACEGRRLSTVKYLIGLVNIDANNESEETPFLLSAKMGFAEIAQFLWKSGASLTQTDEKGQNILHLILGNPLLSKEMLTFLQTIVSARPALIFKKDKQKRTPLHVLAENGHIDAVDILLHHLPGATPQDNEGFVCKETKTKQTAYDIARENNHLALAKKLLYFDVGLLGVKGPSQQKKKSKKGIFRR